MRSDRAMGVLATVIMGVALLPLTLAAQNRARGSMGGGCQLARSIECHYDAQTREDDDGAESVALEAVVIWRVPEALLERRRARVADSAVFHAYREFVRRIEEEQDRSFSGGSSGPYWTGTSKPGRRRMWEWRPGAPMPPDSIWVVDSAFAIPASDTMLVILVDGVYTVDGPPPSIHAVLRRPAVWRETGAKHWTNGDTTFMIRPRHGREAVNDELLAIPEVRAFVERPRSP